MGILIGSGGPMPRSFIDIDMLSRAQGCMLGQLAGDSPGSLVEFQIARDIRRKYPNGVRELANGYSYNIIQGGCSTKATISPIQ